MLPKRWWLYAILFIVGISIILFFVFSIPRVVSTHPAGGEIDILSGTPIQITFQTQIQAEDYQKYIIIHPEIPGTFTRIGNTVVFTPSGKWSEGEVVTVKIKGGLRSKTGIPMLIGKDWDFTIRHAWLFFLLPEGESVSLYRYNTGDYEIQRVISTPGGIQEYILTSDGKRVVYVTRYPTGDTKIFLHRLDTGESQLVYSCGKYACGSPAVSANGKYLAFVRQRLYPFEPLEHVWLLHLNPDGIAEGDPIVIGDSRTASRFPSWSSDNRLILYNPDAQEYQMFYPEQPGEVVTRLPNNLGDRGTWSPEGDIFLAPSVVLAEGDWRPGRPDFSGRLIRYDTQSGIGTDLTRNDQLEDSQPSFSSDGSQIAFARRFLNTENFSVGRQVWISEPDGTNSHPLTNDPAFNHSGLSWSPDGTRIAAVRFDSADLTGQREIWLFNSRSGKGESLVVDGYSPQWVP